MATNPKLFEIADTLVNLSVKEAKELIDILENEYGIKPANVGVLSVPTENTVAPVEEKTEFDVVLKEVGGQKLQIIKKFKEIANLNLIEAKAIIDAAPCKIREKVNKELAKHYKTELESLGAVVELI